jgi:hypothetical protein
VIYLTGSGLNPKTLPILTRHPMIGALATPASLHFSYVKQFDQWGADNGCFTQGALFNMTAYLSWLTKMSPLAERCHFATAPDVVADAEKTWARSEPTFEAIRGAGYPVALVAQNGIESMDVEWNRFDAIFLGGDTDWKLSSCAQSVVAEAKRRGKWAHMGRVNSLRRLEIAAQFGCDSVDGNYLGFGPDLNIPKLLSWLERLCSAPVFNFGGAHGN